MTEEILQATEIEQALLGSLMVDQTYFWRVADVLEPESFFDPFHQRLYAAMQKYAARDRPITPLTIVAALQGDPGLAEVGGVDYLKSIARAAPAVPNIKDYARILVDKAARRRLVGIAEDLREDALDVEEDASAIADRASEALFDTSRSSDAGEGLVPIYDLMQRALAEAETARNNPGAAALSTGLPTVDKCLGGLLRGRLIVLAGDTSMGKSALAAQIAVHNAKQGNPTAFFALEMSGVEMALRVLSEPSRVSAEKMINGRTSDKEFDAVALGANTIGKIPFYVDDCSNLSVAQIRARAQALRRKHGALSMIVVDHIRLVRGANPRDDEMARSSQITRDLHSMAKDFDCVVLLLGQFNREARKRSNPRPLISDLYGASAIEQNADAIWFIYREEYYLNASPVADTEGKDFDKWLAASHRCRGKAEIFSEKNRMGAKGSAMVRFNAALTSFYEERPDIPISEQESLELVH